MDHHSHHSLETFITEYILTHDLPMAEEHVYNVASETEFAKVVPDSFVMDLLRTCPEVDNAHVERLEQRDFDAIKKVLISELRVREKSDFVEMLGTPQMTEILREVIPIFYGPFSILFCRSDIGSHFKRFTQVVKRLIKVAEDAENHDLAHRQAAYEPVMAEMLDCLFQFVHGAAIGDSGQSIQSSIQWYIDFLRFIHRREVLDVQALLSLLSEPERKAAIAETTALVEYQKLCAANTPPKDRPAVVVIPKLVPAFLAQMQKRLEPTPEAECKSPHPAARAYVVPPVSLPDPGAISFTP